MLRTPDLTELIEKHRALDNAIKHNRKNFISDWNGGHPFVETFLGPDVATLKQKQMDQSRYIFFDEENSLLKAVMNLHFKLERLRLTQDNIAAGPGSSSFIAAISLWLRYRGHTKILYVAPLYYTFHFFLRTLGIQLTPVGRGQAFESDFELYLPPHESVLLLSDPIWYAGRRMPLQQLLLIAEWQRQTKSLVIVDGSFQYMQWFGDHQEYSSVLNPELTFRLICPTKSLAIPFFRFAYVLHPTKYHDDFLFIYESIVGGASVSDLVFAHRAVQVLTSDASNHDLTNFLKAVYQRLLQKDLIKTDITPECGYFAFAVPTLQLSNRVAMDQEYFELKGYPDYVRINLMAAHQIYSETPGSPKLS